MSCAAIVQYTRLFAKMRLSFFFLNKFTYQIFRLNNEYLSFSRILIRFYTIKKNACKSLYATKINTNVQVLYNVYKVFNSVVIFLITFICYDTFKV